MAHAITNRAPLGQRALISSARSTSASSIALASAAKACAWSESNKVVATSAGSTGSTCCNPTDDRSARPVATVPGRLATKTRRESLRAPSAELRQRGLENDPREGTDGSEDGALDDPAIERVVQGRKNVSEASEIHAHSRPPPRRIASRFFLGP